MAAHALSVLPVIPSQSCKKPIENSLILKPENLSNSFIGTKLSIQSSSNFTILAAKRRSSIVATVLCSLPTGKERNASEGKPIWSASAIKSFEMGRIEARRLRYPNTGTESLLMGILVEGTGLAAKFFRKHGITFYKVQNETLELLGKSAIQYASPMRPPLTQQAQKALDWAVDEKLKSGESGEVTTALIVLGIWADKESAGHKILAALGFDDEKAKELADSPDEDGSELPVFASTSLNANGLDNLPELHPKESAPQNALAI